MQEKEVTISEVAVLAGVSIATVSRVINNTGNVTDASRKKVEAAIKELNYKTNSLASNLKRGRTQIIGLIIPKVTNVFFMQVMEGLENILAGNGYQLMVSVSYNDLKKEAELLEKMISLRLDAIIVASSSQDGRMFRKIKVPVVLIDRRVENAGADMVSDENYFSTYNLTKELIKAGHRKIAILNGLLPGLAVMRERFQGAIDAIEDAGLIFDKKYLILANHETISLKKNDIKETLEKWKNAEDMPTALVSLNGKQTESALLAASELDISIPEDLSLVSFGKVGTELVRPKVTCVVQDGHRIGEKAGELVLQRLKSGKKTLYQDLIFECEIQKGESVRNLIEK